jgi:ATP phosphoribosyltransferase
MDNQALILALPSKGRLQEQVMHYLSDAGIALKKVTGARDYRATLAGHPGVVVKLMSSAEIATALGAGEVHLGVTGEDLIRESLADADRSVALLQPLGFGFADVVVAVPRAWIDVSTMADLDDVCTAFHARHHRRLRVATKYLTLTRGFFASHGIADYRIVESLGATEGAPAAGLAEVVVDITTTGATLAANDLKVLDDGIVLKSQAQLAASRKAAWTKAARGAAALFTSRIAARELARDSYILRVKPEKSRQKLGAGLVEDGACTILSGPSGDSGGAYVLLCRKAQLTLTIARLRDEGIGAAIAAETVDYVFSQDNALMRRLEAALPR